MKTIRIGTNDYSKTKIKNNIMKTYLLRIEKENNHWYQEANEWAVEVSEFLLSFTGQNVSVQQVLGVVSALSPMQEWNKNKEIAIELIMTGDTGYMERGKQKARDILAIPKMLGIHSLDSEIKSILNGEKTKTFYENMVYPTRSSGVTVDRHAISIAIGHIADDKEQSISKDVYTFIEKCYIMTAETLGLAPLHLQSITWQTWKRIK
jgi:hypothetical protein|tara:strand:- start:210 stop:830 length:621 start_codon:yes stop_codon:yes gene_type:complete